MLWFLAMAFNLWPFLERMATDDGVVLSMVRRKIYPFCSSSACDAISSMA